ncbi:MAG: hypothetical protein ICV83_11230 [Cytophagales bacterium]|nr:hypothetical protein [Cytophagales bacterium]
MAQNWVNGGNYLSATGRIGTNSNNSFAFRTNNTERGRITNSGWWGIGTSTPQSTLHLSGHFTTGWGVNFYHYEPTFATEHRKKIWLKRQWDGFNGDYLMLCSSGNRSNTAQSSLVLTQHGVYIGRGKDDGTGLSSEWLRINENGHVGIGTINLDPYYKLSVGGPIRATEVRVSTGWADYVFEEGYPLKPLAEVAQYIKENKHLPDVPSAAEVAQNGINVGEMHSILLRKIEELTLHMIDLKRENEQLRNRLEQLPVPSGQK